jgi:HNH endonuclease
MHYKDKTLGLTAAKLRKILRYDRATGDFFWRENGTGHGSTARLAGTKAGTRFIKGWRVELPGYDFGFLMHRLAWLYVKGVWPRDQIDHKDKDRWNNRWSNLRESSNSQNQANRGLRPHNKSGVTGVLHSRYGWYAECSINGVRVLQKWFKTKKEAVAARQAAVVRYHGDFAA